jgi:putative transposase
MRILHNMPNYIRAFVPGGSFFFTVAILERRRELLTEHVGALRAAFARTLKRQPFTIDAIVVLPDHLHCISTLPPGDADFSSRWHSIKSTFSRALPADERLSARRVNQR